MATKVTAEDWEKTFSNSMEKNKSPQRMTRETIQGLSVGARALGQLIEEKYKILKYSERVPIGKRVPVIVSTVDALRSLREKSDHIIESLFKEIRRSSNKLIQCELLGIIHDLVLIDQLVFENRKQREATKVLHDKIKLKAQISNLNVVRNMIRVGSLQEEVRAEIHGTPLSDNLSFMRRLNPHVYAESNLKFVKEKLIAINKKIDKNKPDPTEPRLDDFGTGLYKGAHTKTMANKPQKKCGKCGEHYDPTKDGFTWRDRSFCQPCFDKLIASIPK